MKTFWDERFSAKEFAYGTEPNEFFKNQLKNLDPGKILFPAEGEGRNAVYAATLGWEVYAFDPSKEGKKKAEKLAGLKRVKINYLVSDYENIQFEADFFDCIVLIFAHMPPLKREQYHHKLSGFLKPGGTLILKGFSKNQISKNTGGPKNIDMLFSREELGNDFKNFTDIKIEEQEVHLNEGIYHDGIASVIQLVGIR